MEIKVKDLAEVKATILAKITAQKSKGRSDEQAKAFAQDYLDDNTFSDESGTILSISLADLETSGGDANQIMGKAIGDAVREALKGVTIGTSGKPPATVEVAEPWEKFFDGSATESKTWGFKNVGEFAQAVFTENHPVTNMRRTDKRLELLGQASKAFKAGTWTKATPTTYASELIGADGGFLVPPEYREQIWTAVHDDYSIMSLIDMTPTSSNNVNLNVDQNTPWDNTSGVQVYWRQQASTMSQSKPIFQNRTIALNEIYAFVPATDELLADAPRLNNYLGTKAPEKMGYAVDDAIFRGTGQGQPLGVLPGFGPSTITVTPNSTSNGYSLTDFANMYPRLLQGPNMVAPQGIWLMTPREYALLPTLGTGSNAGFPLALTNQNIEGRIILSALGMPIYSSQHLPGANQLGSIMLANMKGYLGFNKSDGFDFQSSIHLFFDSGAVALRWRFRFGGEPALRSTIASANDTGNTMSHFVVLGGRPS